MITFVFHKKLTTALFWMLRARFAYFKVFSVSSAFVSAGLTQATLEEKENYNPNKKKKKKD